MNFTPRQTTVIPAITPSERPEESERMMRRIVDIQTGRRSNADQEEPGAAVILRHDGMDEVTAIYMTATDAIELAMGLLDAVLVAQEHWRNSIVGGNTAIRRGRQAEAMVSGARLRRGK